MNQMTTAPLQPAPTHIKVAFSGERRSFFGLVARGAGLEMITAGFYRFWLTTDIRRHLWSHTVVDGDGAEYTGRGKELLIGFLVAMAILMPIYLGYFILDSRSRAFGGVRQRPPWPLHLRVRAIRDLSRPALPHDAHRLARRPLLDDRLRLGLCVARLALGPGDDLHPRPRPAVARRGARALQDAAHALWRPAGQLRGQGLGLLQEGLVALAADADRHHHLYRHSLRLRAVQGRPVPLVAERTAARRRAARVAARHGCVHRPLLEGDRLDHPDVVRARPVVRARRGYRRRDRWGRR